MARRSPRSSSSATAETETYTGDIVVVACGAANSARLLLASATDKHPNGLANGSDQVGRNYMCHNSLAVMALSKEPNPTVFQKTLALNDWYLGADDWDFPLGNIQMLGKSQAPMIQGEKPRGDQACARLDARERRLTMRSTSGSRRGPAPGRRTGSRWTATVM